jgi:cell division protein FtsB
MAAAARFLDPASIPLKRQGGGGGNIWATLVTVTQGLTGVVGLAGLALFFLPVIQQTQQYQSEQAVLRAKIQEAQDEQQQIRIETEHMKTDPAYVEGVARDRLQMGKPNETIVHFPPYQSSTPTTRIAHPVPENDSSW